MPPSITSTSGTWNHGNSVTITGTNFGATGPTGSNLLLWDDFSNGTVGSILNASPQFGSWSPDNRPDPVYANDQSHGPGGKSCKGSNTPTNQWSNFFVTFAQKTKLYQCMWFRWNSTDTNNAALKLSQVHGNDAGDFAPGIMSGALNLLPAAWWASYISTEGGACDLDTRVTYTGAPSQDTWYFWERIAIQSTANATCSASGDGYVEVIMNGEQEYIQQNRVTRENAGNGWVETSFGHGVTNSNGNTNIWLADAYLTASLARVIVANNSTLNSSATHREIQYCTSWADGSITMTVNRGSFGASAGAWLFVVDDSNNISSGFAITFGQGSGGTTTQLSPAIWMV